MKKSLIVLTSCAAAAAMFVVLLNQTRNVEAPGVEGFEPPIFQGVDVESDIDRYAQSLDALVAEVDEVRLQAVALTARQAILERDYARLAEHLAAEVGAESHSLESDSSQDGQGDYFSVQQPTPQQALLDEEAGQLNRLMTMDNAMYGQQADDLWEQQATGELTDSAHDAIAAGSELQGVACRGAMCRIEIFHAGEDKMMSLFEGEQELVPWSHKGRVETIEHDSGEITSIVYVTREGYEFPQGF